MKLAEALQERADLNTKISNLNLRLRDNAIVQEGEKPAEDPKDLLLELDLSAARLQDLIAHINKTNCLTQTSQGTITELIARKDILRLRISSYRDLIHSASQIAHRASLREIKILSSVNVPELQRKTDLLSKELRQTDNLIQELNWKTELL